MASQDFFLCLRSMWLPMAINPAASSRDKSTRTGAIMRTMGMDTLDLETLLVTALESFGVVRGGQMTGRELPA